MRTPLLAAALLAATIAAPLAAQRAGRRHPACDPDNAGIVLPPGFCALMVADSVGRSRHIAALPNGDLAVALDGQDGGVLILSDTNGDGRADVRHKFGPGGGTGIAVHGGYLYFGMNRAIVRWPWPAGTLEPHDPPDTIVSGLLAGGQHAAKNIAVGIDGSVYVNIGAPSNACQQRDRTSGSPGRDPCTLLDSAGGIWRFDPTRLRQALLCRFCMVLLLQIRPQTAQRMHHPELVVGGLLLRAEAIIGRIHTRKERIASLLRHRPGIQQRRPRWHLQVTVV